MIDLHLINVALASLGIGAGAVMMIAATVIAIAAIVQHRAATRSQQAHAQVTAKPRQASPVSPVQRQPALR